MDRALGPSLPSKKSSGSASATDEDPMSKPGVLPRRGRSLSFVAQFALLSGVLLTLAGATLAQVLGHLIEQRAREDAVNTAVVITSLGISPNLDTSEFARPLNEKDQARLRQTLGMLGGQQGSDGSRH